MAEEVMNNKQIILKHYVEGYPKESDVEFKNNNIKLNVPEGTFEEEAKGKQSIAWLLLFGLFSGLLDAVYSRTRLGFDFGLHDLLRLWVFHTGFDGN
ncbi:hypothetical protein H5410_059095 [Solanum commersonii]|uniref:Uncharacterized protein n=1 Tax=Solanum commersonii TaxID=4109 RepID=A0A9J5W1P5_SOLCO|nr:hypothetical protein H5410_059095 [Solanum commersonii]